MNIFSKLFLLILLVSLSYSGFTLANETLVVGELSVARGESKSGVIHIASGTDSLAESRATSIPITVFNGPADGPVLTLIAGIHGSEYPPILAMQKVTRLLDSRIMKGAVIIVHNANLPSFRNRSVYIGPIDQKNLNRSFPGKEAGTITERIAFAITQQVIKQTDYLIDIHAGDANENLNPSYTAYYAEAGSKETQARSRRMTIAFGLETIVLFSGATTSPKSQIYTGAQAVTLGVAAMDVESGGQGSSEEVFIRPIVNGVMSVMRDLEIIDGEPQPATNPLFISERARVYSEFDGVWHPTKRIEAGQYIQKGTILGVITDYYGRELEKVFAPASGLLLILFATPPVNKGDNIAVIGLLDAQ